MNRRALVQRMGMFSLVGAIPFHRIRPDSASLQNRADGVAGQAFGDASPLKPPAKGSIPVAFVISEGAVVIDFSGPWEVFENVDVPGREESPFRLYTVSGNAEVIHASGGMKITPNYTFKTAPTPKVIVIPAQNASNEEILEWIRKSNKTADLTMSVCTGAFVLARTGLLQQDSDDARFVDAGRR